VFVSLGGDEWFLVDILVARSGVNQTSNQPRNSKRFAAMSQPQKAFNFKDLDAEAKPSDLVSTSAPA
jgi:hypothetical protein